MPLATAVALLPRGVRRADYLVDGEPVLLAIDSLGNCIRRVKLTPNMDEESVRAWLEGLLEHYDPAPTKPELRLLPPTRRPRLPTAVLIMLNRPHARRG